MLRTQRITAKKEIGINIKEDCLIENIKKDDDYTGYLVGAGMLFIAILLYFIFSHWLVTVLSFFLYVFGILFLATELGQKGNRGFAFIVSGIGFLILTMMFMNSDNVIFKIIFIFLSTVTFLIFLASFIEAHQVRKNHFEEKSKKKVNELKFNNNYQMSLEIFSAIGSGASIFGLIYEFFL